MPCWVLISCCQGINPLQAFSLGFGGRETCFVLTNQADAITGAEFPAGITGKLWIVTFLHSSKQTGHMASMIHLTLFNKSVFSSLVSREWGRYQETGQYWVRMTARALQNDLQPVTRVHVSAQRVRKGLNEFSIVVRHLQVKAVLATQHCAA